MPISEGPPADLPARSADVDAVLAALPSATREALQALRETIRAAAPSAVESINYGVPAFKYRGRPFVSFGAGKAHCSLYVQSPAVMEAHADELAGYDTSKGTIRFRAEVPLPAALITKLVRARMAEVEGRDVRA